VSKQSKIAKTVQNSENSQLPNASEQKLFQKEQRIKQCKITKTVS